jgi:hypothetical protein
MKTTIQNAIDAKDLNKLNELQKVVKQSIEVKRGFLKSANITVENSQSRFSSEMQENAKQSVITFESEIKEYEGLVNMIKRAKTELRK